MSFDLASDRKAVLARADGGLAAVEQEAFGLRYAVLVVEEDGTGLASVAAERLVHASQAMLGPGSPPMALVAAGAFEGAVLDVAVGQAQLPDGRSILVVLVGPGP